MQFKRRLFVWIFLLGWLTGCRAGQNPTSDWLIASEGFKVRITVVSGGRSVELANGLIRRVIKLKPNTATIAFDNLMTGENLIRAVRPEALVTIGGVRYKVGGLLGQVKQAYFRPEWIDSLRNDPTAMQFMRYEIGPIRAPFSWKSRGWCTNRQWPSAGKALHLYFRFPSNFLKNLTVVVHYALYDGVPLISKWLTFRNDGNRTVRPNTRN